jgi:DNA-binding transcriptional regulator GbsR (MarR family)
MCRHSCIRSDNITKQIKTSISAREVEISTAISSTDAQLAAVQTGLEEVRLDDTSEDRIQDAEDVTNMVKQIEEQRSALELSRKLQEELLSKLKEEAVAKAAGEKQKRAEYITFGNLERGFQIGTNNATISDIHF